MTTLEAPAPVIARRATKATTPSTEEIQPSDLGRISNEFKLASDATRLRILMLLDGGEKNVTELCRATGHSQPALSHHGALLRVSGTIEGRREGKFHYYRLTPKGEAIVAAVRTLAAL